MLSAELFCTTIIPTIRRDTLDRTVESVLSQKFDQPFEVIVVNDSGRPLTPAAWQQAPQVQIFHTQNRERSVARNVGAAVARGRYLHFLDDDDWLLPGALAVFWLLAETHPTAWLYGAAQLTDSSGRCLFQFDHRLSGNCLTQVMAGEWVPLQASLIPSAAFFEVGGFDATLTGAQDKDLLLRIAQHYDLAGTATPVVGILRGIWSSATDWNSIPAKWHRAIERALAQPGTLARMRASATDPYWHGRWLRAYLLSAWRNIQSRRLFTFLSRLSHAAVIALLAGARLMSADFWRALTHAHLTAGFNPAARSTEHAPSRTRLDKGADRGDLLAH